MDPSRSNMYGWRAQSGLKASRGLGSTLRDTAFSIMVIAFLVGGGSDKEDEQDAMHENDMSKEAIEGKTIFIPLGFAYKLPRTHYKGMDPELQSFIQLANDKKQRNYLKNQLTSMVGQYVGSKPSLQSFLGEKSKPSRFWLDIDFPRGPPPEYERKGFVDSPLPTELQKMTSHHIRWSTRPVHPLHYSKTQKALWPDSLASSFWASQKTLASLQYEKIKNLLAFSATSEAPGSESDSRPTMQLQKLSEQTEPQKQESACESTGDSPPEASTSKKERDGLPPKNRSSDGSRFFPVTVTIPDLGDDTVSAVEAFKKTFARTWRPAPAPPERGTVIFSGLVELVGPKGIVLLDVHAAYHPVESRWTQVSLFLRRVQPRKPVPPGGS
ncbi:MAG: hypothetical protein Q9207_004137 [Kuettlingeria erythrocarpa]